MKKEIGSFYEIEEGITKTNRHEGVEQWMQTVLSQMELQFFCSGREAIEAALEDIEYRKAVQRKVCLLPQYTCDTVIIPFEKHGWELHFFQVNQELRTERKIFQQLLEQVSPTVLLAHTYYGVDTLAEIREDIRKWRECQGMIYIEDMTQSMALLSEDMLADYYVGSLRKWFAIPDGSFVASNHTLEVVCKEEKKLFVEQKLEAQMLKYGYLYETNSVKKSTILEKNRMAENYLYEDDSVCTMSKFSRDRWKSLDVQDNFRRRKENAEYLWEVTQNLHKIQAVLNIREGSPLYFPIYVEDREGLQVYLREKDIFAPVLWIIPKQVEGSLIGDTKYIFEHLLALPCDQRYTVEDMKRIGQCLLEYEGK